MVGKIQPQTVLLDRLKKVRDPKTESETTSQRQGVTTPDVARSEAADRVRIQAGKLPPPVQKAIEFTALGEALQMLEMGESLPPGRVADLLFGLRNADLKKGEYVALRKHILKSLPDERKSLNRTRPATTPQPGPEEITQLLLPWTPDRDTKLSVVSSLEAARLATLELQEQVDKQHGRLKNGKTDAATKLASLVPRLSEQEAIVHSFENWGPTRFGEEIARFRTEGRACAPEDAARLLHALQHHRASDAERTALRDALFEGVNKEDWPPSASVNPPTPQSLFAVMSGVNAASSLEGLTDQINATTDADTSRTLKAIRESIVDHPRALIGDSIRQWQQTGRGFDPYFAAPTLNMLESLRLEPEQIDRIKQALLEKIPDSKVEKGQIQQAINSVRAPADLIPILTGEVLGREPLPLSRKKLTGMIADCQEQRGMASLARVKLLDGRPPEALEGADAKELARLDRTIRDVTPRIAELKATRAGVNAVRGERWIDQLEIDVMTGASVGIPGWVSNSVMVGGRAERADEDTGWRELTLTSYAMPAFAFGGYFKASYDVSRKQGPKFDSGFGADFGVPGFGSVWGGKGDDAWGNIFTGGVWSPQIGNLGAGYGVKDGQAYGAFISGIFIPPGSLYASRTDIVIRHPTFAVAGQRGAEFFRKIGESKPMKKGKSAIGWTANKFLRPVVSPIAKGGKEAAFQVKARLKARGLEGDDKAAFVESMRLANNLEATIADKIKSGETDPGKLEALYKSQIEASLSTLESVREDNPEHMETNRLIVAAEFALGKREAALKAAERGLKTARTHGKPKELDDAREDFVLCALSANKTEQAWPVLNEWLQNNDGVKPKVYLMQWLVNQGRDEEARQIAEGVAVQNRLSFSANRAVASLSGQAPTAEVRS